MKIPKVVTKRNGNKKKVYYYYETFDCFEDALNEAKKHKEKDNSKYYILECEVGYWFPQKKAILYLHNKMTLV